MKHLLINTSLLVMGLMTAGAALAISPVPAPDTPDYTTELPPEPSLAQQAQIGKIAANYLLAHPEILAQIKSELPQEKVTDKTPRCALVKDSRQSIK